MNQNPLSAPVVHETGRDGRRRLEVFASADLAAARGTELFLSAARRAISQGGRFTAALSGGDTPVPLFRRIAEAAPAWGIDWRKVHLFWADERCVPPDHAESNYRLANMLLLSRLPAPGAVVHRIPGELPPEEAAELYEAELSAAFGGTPVFDLILLGLGTDGHTASLFPGFEPAGALGRTVVAAHPAGAKHPRVTLTLQVINSGRHVVFFVTGKDKADIIAEVLEGRDKVPYPASLVAPSEGTLTWLLDAEAARRLKTWKPGRPGF